MGLEPFRFRLNHLMEPNQSSRLGSEPENVSWAIPVSGKFRNNADGLIWPTEGLFFTLARHRDDLLVVIKTTAQTMPCQQT